MSFLGSVELWREKGPKKKKKHNNVWRTNASFPAPGDNEERIPKLDTYQCANGLWLG